NLQSIYDSLESARILGEEVLSDLNSYLDKLELDPEKLSHTEQRLSAIFELARKFKTEPENLPALRQELQDRLDATQAQADISALSKAKEDAESKHADLCRQLTQARQVSSATLSRMVTEMMQ